MAMPAPWPDRREITELTVEELGMRVLWLLAERSTPKAHSRQGLIVERTAQLVQEARREATQGFNAVYSQDAVSSEPEVARALAEAWGWLESEGLLALDPLTIERTRSPAQVASFISRWGREVIAEGVKGLELVKAKRRLGLELHPLLAAPLRTLVRVGAFEEAAFKALRIIEERVAELAGKPEGKHGGKLRGEPLMNAAFSPESGPLTDLEAETAEQQGQMNLFKGAFASFRNPLGHRAVEFEDPTEAAEVVLFADLLMRQLDRVEERLKERSPQPQAEEA